MTDAGHTRHGLGKAGTALLLAAAVNVLIFLALANLNEACAVANREPLASTPVLTLVERDEPRAVEQPKEETPPPKPEIMTVNLQQPAPQPLPLEPLSLELAPPSLSAPSVEVVAIPAPPRVSRRPANPGKACAPRGQPATPREADCVDEPPRELAAAPPRYPPLALKRGWEGAVTVRLLIDERGSVQDVRVVSVEGHESFRAAVLEAAPHWRFRPARHGGRLVKVWGIKRVRFELQEER